VPKLPRSRFFVVHNGIDLDVYNTDETQRADNTILTVSNWHRPRKRLETLISAMEYLPNWTLNIGGNFLQRDYEAYCKSLAQRYGGRVRFIGFVHNKAEWMRQATFFVMPSNFEGWSTQLMEAMACGCKVLRVEGGGASEFVPAKELLPRGFTDKDLARQVLWLDEDDSIVGANLAKVQNFSWERVREETEVALQA
jgi:glycosyltransferase involved in cell wall biosynthesis